MDKSTFRILVLDDEPFMLRLIVRILVDQGFERVTGCDNGRVALDHVSSSRPPGLILSDLNMPEMDGIEFIRKLVERSYTGSLILVSGEDERVLQTAERLVQAHRITLLGHLTKPVSPAGLTKLLEKWSPPSSGSSRAARKVYSADEVRAAIANGELVNH